ncbi:MAG: hypothetical protein IJ298_04345 [Ruminococcus sp.]|nr:hypothetical protein [Ruminococcus sp.]
MKKKFSLPIVITIALISAAIAFSAAYIISTSAMNARLTDLSKKQALFSTMADVDSFVREKSYYQINKEKLTEELCRGYAQAYEGRVLYLTAEEYKDSEYTAEAGYTVFVLADSSAMVILTQEQYEALNPTETTTQTQPQ